MSSCIDKEWLAKNPHFRAKTSVRKRVPDMAHAYAPGSGPPGQTCGTCDKCIAKQYNRTFYKCRVMLRHWTKGRATDVRKRDAACMAWEPRMEKLEVVSVMGRVGRIAL